MAYLRLWLYSGVIAAALFFAGAPLSAQSLTHATTWIGNTWPGSGDQTATYAQERVRGIYVAPNGAVFTTSSWDDGHHSAGVYQNGNYLGVAGAGISGSGGNGNLYSHFSFYSNAPAIAGDGTYVYIGGMIDQGNWTMIGSGVERFSISTNATASFTGGYGVYGDEFAVDTATSAQVPASLAVCAYTHRLVVADPNTNTFKVFNTATPNASAIASWSISGFTIPSPSSSVNFPARLFMCGSPNADEIYVGINNQIKCYTSTGTPVSKSITDMVNPGPMAFDNQGRLMVWEEGANQYIRIYTVSGSSPVLATTFGTAGGVYAGSTPGVRTAAAMDPGCWGIGMDSSGNVYQACDINGIGGFYMRSWNSSATPLWDVAGQEWVTVGDFDPATDGLDIFTGMHHYTMDYTKPLGQEPTYYAETDDELLYPTDGNSLNLRTVGPIAIRRLQGRRVMYTHSGQNNASGGYDVYAFDNSGNGQIAHHVTTVDPAQSSYGVDVAANGDVYQVSQTQPMTVTKWPFTGFDGSGNPTFGSAVTVCTLPTPEAGFPATTQNAAMRAHYDSANDSLYVTAYDNSYPYSYPSGINTGGLSFGSAGRRLARYDNVSTSPTIHAGYPITLPWNMSAVDQYGNSVPVLACSIATAGNYLFVLEAWNWVVDVYNANSGAFVGQLLPSAQVSQVGIWNILSDMSQSFNVFERSNGTYLVLTEDDIHNKNILYEWTPAPAAPAGLTATPGSAQAALSWTASNGATSYNVYRGTYSGGESSTAIATGITGTSYTNTGLTNGTTYYYTVAAVNAGGASGYSNEANATPASSVTVANGVYKFVDAAGYAMDDPNGGGAGTAVDQVAYSGTYQQWTVTSVGSGRYKILAPNGLALTGATANAQLTLATYTGATNQLWMFQGVGSLDFVVNVATGQAMDDWGGGSGVAVGQWQFLTPNTNREWTVTAVNANLAPDPGFELTPINANGWVTNPYSGTPTFTWASGVVHSGGHSASISGTSCLGWYASSMMPVTSGASYTFSSWVNTSAVTGSGANVVLSEFNSSGTWIRNDSTSFITGTNGWTYLSSSVALSSTCTQVVLDLYLNGGGAAYFDDVSVTKN